MTKIELIKLLADVPDDAVVAYESESGNRWIGARYSEVKNVEYVKQHNEVLLS